MAIRDLFRRRQTRIPADPADLAHFRSWCETRVGVEAYLEPETLVSVPGLLLVAFDGEWTRRPVGDVATARKLADQLKIPLYDAMETGYPDRMRLFEEVRISRERKERARRLREQMRGADEG
ncbi:oxidoreductase [Dietzia cercidiphylli]|uniref:oxidoreductase n=1 Tax=Dietzia cercidiphylli TaxID=498199 RepID=UPI003F7CFE03